MIQLMPVGSLRKSVPSGATIPASPGIGDLFLHTPAGRKVLMQYDGSSWIPIISYGTFTVYVDKTDGTDDTAHGTGVDGDAFATIQYAVDAIPGLVGGEVTVNINGETYSEDVVIQGKAFTGNSTITIQGTLSLQGTGTAEGGSVQGTGATQGSIADTGEFGSFDNMLIYLAGLDEYRIIDSDSADVATIVGTFSGNPDGDVWTVYDWGTKIAPTAIGITIASVQTGVVINDICFTQNEAWMAENFSSVEVNRCKSVSSGSQGCRNTQAWMRVNECYFSYSNASQRCISLTLGYTFIARTKVYGNGQLNNAIRAVGGHTLVFKGTIIDNCDHAQGAVRVEANGGMSCWSAAADGYPRIRNSVLGIYAYRGGSVSATGNNQYSGNGTNESADAASYGYVD